jgi:hypothetical protein
MILTLIGLGLNFIGSILLIVDSLKNFRGVKTNPIIEHPDDPKRRKIYDQTRRRLKEVKISKEEVKLIIALSFLSAGFFLQILDLLF